MAKTSRKAESINFEALLKRLEEIVRRLEDEQAPLEESLKLFAEGKKLARSCESELQRIDLQIRKLMEDAEGAIHELEAPELEDEEDGEAEPAKSSDIEPATKPEDDLPF